MPNRFPPVPCNNQLGVTHNNLGLVRQVHTIFAAESLTMPEQEHLVVQLVYQDPSEDIIQSVLANEKQLFSQIEKAEFYQYLQKLSNDGWSLVRFSPDGEGREAYYFRRSSG